MAHFCSDPYGDYTLLTRVGATATAVERTGVYCADTPTGAEEIVTTFAHTNRHGGQWSASAAPPGLPHATCQTTHMLETLFWCAVTVGRYASTALGSPEKDVHQPISAQYVILTTADQSVR